MVKIPKMPICTEPLTEGKVNTGNKKLLKWYRLFCERIGAGLLRKGMTRTGNNGN